MSQHRFSGRLMTLAYTLCILLLVAYAMWLYFMGEYEQLLLPTFLSLVMVVTILLHIGQGLHSHLPRILTLICTALLVAFAWYRHPDTPDVWLGLPLAAAFLLLPLWAALLCSLVVIPLWWWLPLPIPATLGRNEQLGYLTLIALLAMPRWEHGLRQALLRATDPTDNECSAYHSDTLNERLKSEYQRAAMLSQRMAVLVLHLPQWEMAGEQFGNRARIALLEALCSEVQSSCRDHDIIGRASSATFWVVLPDTSESGALLVRERLQRALSHRVLVETGQLEVRIALCLPSPQEPFARFAQRLKRCSEVLSEQ
ncbi:diguanylate cyclase [Halomonas sp. Bachu 37]|uniref:diguanylate cyclase domain-containing protein n=1 Tax=Halomonas kashgarensis TaxID=3084920 RepID=UPI003217F866